MSNWGVDLKGSIDLSYMNNVLTEAQMMQIGLAALSVIQTETQDNNTDQDGRPFKPYNKDYAQLKVTEYKAKTKDVNLTLTSQMQNSMSVLNATDRSVTIGFIDSTPARGGLRPSQKMLRTNKARPWFGFGGPNSKRRNRIFQIASEIFIEALTRRSGGSN